MHRSVRISAVLIVCSLAMAACNPTLRAHGHRYGIEEEPNVVVAEDTQQSVLQRFGNPSTRGTFQDDTWYYISATRESLAYLRPSTRDRRIIAITFDADGVVAAVNEFGLDDGRVVAYSYTETPTRGRQLSILEQLLGNVGSLPNEQFGGEQNLPGGAGGPRRDQ